MGEVRAKLELENSSDRAVVERGFMDPSKVRRIQTEVMVDTGAVMLVLPEDLVEKLGLVHRRKAIVTYAERTEERPVAGPVTVVIGDRSAIVACIVGPPLSEPLLGQIPLEAMDLLVDPIARSLRPRPESPYLPALKLK